MKAQSELPVDTKLEYTIINNVPTINIAAAMTTQAQVIAIIKQLEKLSSVLPETKARKRAKAKNGPRAARARNTIEEKIA